MTFHLIHTQNLPIFEQLQLEEALLRTDDRNFCIINEGSTPAIVMGISGKVEELVDREKTAAANVPVIKRFSGGGTVIVDEETIFFTFICQKSLHPFPAYPEPILKWSADFYQAAFPALSLRENDYAIGEKKCGGNAQYIKKDRWLHHTSFLWDWKKERMDLLLHPKKTPAYRAGRTHAAFLGRVSDHADDKTSWIGSLKKELSNRYAVQEMSLEEVKPVMQRPHRQTSESLSQPLLSITA
jgi:lipoate-protein ligase A